jgi:hypothetical protein
MLFKILKLFGLDVPAKVAAAKSVIEQRAEEVAEYAGQAMQTVVVIAALSASAGILGAVAVAVGLYALVDADVSTPDWRWSEGCSLPPLTGLAIAGAAGGLCWSHSWQPGFPLGHDPPRPLRPRIPLRRDSTLFRFESCNKREIERRETDETAHHSGRKCRNFWRQQRLRPKFPTAGYRTRGPDSRPTDGRPPANH